MTRRPGIVPDEQLARVITTIYQQADEAGWENLAPRDRSRLYGQWVESEQIGGVLAQYMTPEAARSWIKDGPMKEYGRANRGSGRYADFGRTGGTTIADIARAALGDNALVVPDSERVKPLRFRAQVDQDEVLIAWGESRHFKDLVWAALQAAAEEDVDAHVVVMEPPGRAASPTDRARHAAIATRCDIPVHYLREVLGTRPGRA